MTLSFSSFMSCVTYISNNKRNEGGYTLLVNVLQEVEATNLAEPRSVPMWQWEKNQKMLYW